MLPGRAGAPPEQYRPWRRLLIVSADTAVPSAGRCLADTFSRVIFTRYRRPAHCVAPVAADIAKIPAAASNPGTIWSTLDSALAALRVELGTVT